MLAPARVGLFAALVTLASISHCLTVVRRRQALPARRSRRGGDQARSPDQDRRRHGRPSRCAQLRREADAALPAQRFPRRHARCSARSSRWRRTTARTGCGLRAPSCRSAPANDRERSAAARARRDRRLHRLSARHDPREEADSLAHPRPHLRAIARCGGRRSMRCGCRSNCARSPTCARTTSGCARSTASACSTTRSMRTPPRRAPASSSPRSCRASAPISRPSSRSPARTSRRSRPTTSSFASKA